MIHKRSENGKIKAGEPGVTSTRSALGNTRSLHRSGRSPGRMMPWDGNSSHRDAPHLDGNGGAW